MIPIFFAPGQQFDTITITPISDGIQEGFETVTCIVYLNAVEFPLIVPV